MSVDLTAGPGGSGQQPTDDEVIDMAKEAIEVSRDELRRGRDAVLSTDLQQPGVTVDLGHRSIVRLPDEVIDIIKDEIERYASFLSLNFHLLERHSATPSRLGFYTHEIPRAFSAGRGYKCTPWLWISSHCML